MKKTLLFATTTLFCFTAHAQPAPSNTEVRLGIIEEQMRDLTGKIEQLEHENQELKSQLGNGAAQQAPSSTEQVIIRKPAETPPENWTPDTAPAAGVVPPPAPKEPEAKETAKPAASKTDSKTPSADGTKTLGTIPATKAPEAPAASTPEGEYDDAFSLLREEKYDDAIAAFEHFNEKYPDNTLVGNAHYWIGECYYAKKEYDQASVHFLKTYQKYPKGQKAPDTLLKLAMSLQQLDKKKEACTTLEKLYQDFPKMPSSVRQKADAERKRGCK
ncbi:MAG: tol-pal system protein YbgF [Proteobacteria bacterium]|nr:tol-pal system protein YbgF [Pseudomonadota bacterium]